MAARDFSSMTHEELGMALEEMDVEDEVYFYVYGTVHAPTLYGRDVDLEAAASQLSVTAMKRALRAGAGPDTFNKRVVIALAVVEAEDAEGRRFSARQLAALRLLRAHHLVDEHVASAVLNDAASTCSTAFVRELLDAGADIVLFDPDGTTPLHCATRGKMVRLLVEAGFSVNAARRYDGRRPLHDACTWPSAVKELLACGADPNAQTAQGDTPLHACATINATGRSVRALLAHGADPSMRNEKGETVADVFKRKMTWSLAADIRVDVRRARAIAYAAAWYRRRHILLAVRGLYTTAASPSASGSAASASSSSAGPVAASAGKGSA